MYKNIEFVCAGNNGRSPIAEAVADKMLTILGLQDQVKVTSSGTYVGLPDESTTLKEILEPFVEKGLARGILNPAYKSLLETDPQKVAETLIANEERMRTAYLSQSLGYAPDHERKQTVTRPGADLILPMDNSNLERVTQLYTSESANPTIETLGEFSGLGLNLEQDFPETDSEYLKTAVKVEAATRAAILRAVDLI